MSNYTSKDIKTLEGLQAIQMRPAMYIGSTDTDGMHHLLLEIISNSIDEALNGYGKEIKISINTKENSARVEDNGRGIPFGPMENGKEAMIEVFTNLNSGGKFGQGGYSVSGGLHGIGSSAVNALSSIFKATSQRDNKKAELTAKKGLVSDFNVKDIVSKDRGSIIYFIPDTTYFGKTKWDAARIEQTVLLLSHLTTGVLFTLNIDGVKKTFLSKDGMKDLIKEKTKGLETITDITYLNTEANNMLVEIAFQYVNGGGEKIYAFTNNIPNADGGTHITGFKTSLTNQINSAAKIMEELKPGDDNLTGDSIRRGIVAAISIKMNETPQFTNQTKDKLQNPSARTAVSQAMGKINIARKDLEIIIKKALLEKKAEDAAKRAREAAKKVVSGGRNMNMLRDLPEKLKDCNKPNGELYLVEGDSAAGSAESGRDPQTQAILPLRGKVLNTYGKELADIIENKEIKDILTALGCGIGENFNIANLRYDKIILMADADVDGAHINTLLMTLFLQHLPQLVLAGKVYRAVPPLFGIKKGKNVTYIQDQVELDKYIKKHGQPSDIIRYKGLGEMNPHELWDTTMNPESRTLVQLNTTNINKTMALFETLMGPDSSKRREYIMKNAKEMI